MFCTAKNAVDVISATLDNRVVAAAMDVISDAADVLPSASDTAGFVMDT